MYIDMIKSVNVPYGYYCKDCSECKISGPKYADHSKYCNITGEFLEKSKDGNYLKTDVCFSAIRNALKEG